MEESCSTLLFVGRLEMVNVMLVVVVFCFFVGGWSASVDAVVAIRSSLAGHA